MCTTECCTPSASILLQIHKIVILVLSLPPDFALPHSKMPQCLQVIVYHLSSILSLVFRNQLILCKYALYMR